MSIFVFDAYGTLFDVHAAIARFREQAGPDADRMSEIWRLKQLEYSWTLTLAGHYMDFWRLTERALDYSLARVASVPKALKPDLLDAYFKLDAFPDARAALRALKAKGHKTGILSNGSPNMLKGAVDAAGIGGDLDAVLSVDVLEDVQAAAGGLRPGHRSFQMQAGRCDLRVLQPLGRDGGATPSASARCGSTAARCRTNISISRPQRTLSDLSVLGGFRLTGAGARSRRRLYPRHSPKARACSMPSIISVNNLSKTYASGFRALKDINLDIQRGEIFALLGPNGAGKTTLIGIICGILNPSQGSVTVDGHDIIKDFRAARSLIGLVPQELHTDAFESVWATVNFSRGLFGKPKNPAHIEKVLRELSLWDKKDNKIMTLSGGMKRRVLIAKALSHEPRILFLDEPTAGVDVELRKDMWQVVRDLRASGVTIILTTHYIEEAEDMADRVGVISKGEIILVEEKAELMRKLGKKKMILHLQKKLDAVPAALAAHALTLADGGAELVFTYDTQAERTGVTTLLSDLNSAGIRFRDLQTEQSSLEDIFVGLVSDRA